MHVCVCVKCSLNINLLNLLICETIQCYTCLPKHIPHFLK